MASMESSSVGGGCYSVPSVSSMASSAEHYMDAQQATMSQHLPGTYDVQSQSTCMCMACAWHVHGMCMCLLCVAV